VENHGRSERYIIVSTGREVSPAGPSDKCSVKVKTLRGLEAVF
jgi:hypothetical protein